MTPKNELEEKWKDLHTEVVNRIIRFLKENGVNNVTFAKERIEKLKNE